MKILGLVIVILGAVFSFAAAPLVRLIKKTEEASEKEIVNTKLLGLLIAVIGLAIVFLG